nr:sigma-70 family RNA polymerase sigma factor [Rhodovibrio salinarum]
MAELANANHLQLVCRAAFHFTYDLPMRRRQDLISCFEACRDELLSFLRRRTDTPDRAEDLAQETYIRLAAVSAETEIANLRAYIFRTAANLATDSGRREGARHTRLASEEAGRHVADPAPTPDRIVSDRRRLTVLERALDELSPNARTAFVLNRYDGLTHTQIAHHLGVSNSMVAKYISQALRHCRQRLDAYDTHENNR